MPFIHTENITEDCRLVVWQLTESNEELRKLLLPAADLTEYATISHPQKQREWLAGRVVLEQLLASVAQAFEGTTKDAHGKPFLIGSDWHISLTHTAAYVAAVGHPTQPLGIDMEKVDDKLRRTARKYLNEAELANAGEDLTTLCMYWCGKEALYKLNGRNQVSFRDHINIVLFLKTDTTLRGTLDDAGQRIESDLHVRWLGTYCLVVAV